MDLNFKGNWVGNMYQRFETMCQDVDDFVSKDTVRHVQIVGESVKKLYSGVVEDILPPLVDPVKHAAQVLPLKQIDSFGTYARSIVGIEENSLGIDTKESSTNEEDLTFPDTSNLTEQCLDSKPVDEKNNNVTKAMVPIATTIDDQGSRSSPEEELSWSWSSDGDASMYENAERGAEYNVDSEVAVDEYVMEERAKNMSKTSLCSAPADESPNNDTSAEGPLSTLVDNSGLRSSDAEEILSKSFLDEVEGDSNTSSSLRNSEEFSVVCCDGKFESSRNSPPTESHSLSDFSDTNCPKEADMFCCDSTDVMACFSEFPSALELSASFQGLAFDNKEADVSSSSILSLKSDDVNTTTIRSDEALSTAEYSKIKHEQYYGFVPFEASMSSLETGIADSSTIDVADPSLETIDLSDKVKIDESWGLIPENNPVNSYSFHSRRQRSYKKIIQDAFASRKRLTKEYKQLGILYGDIDIDSSSYPRQNSLPSNSTSPLESKESQTEDLCDSEWELL